MKSPENEFSITLENALGPAPQNPDAPKVVFPTVYQITRDQETALCNRIQARLRQLESELGRDVTQDIEWWAKPPVEMADGSMIAHHQTFMGKRQLYELMFENKWEWRASVLGGLFAESNHSVPLARRIATQMIARTISDVFGTDPWFSCWPAATAADVERADAVEKFAKVRFETLEMKPQLRSAIRGSFVRGEAVVKTTYTDSGDYYDAEETILVDAGGQPVLAMDGDYITLRDIWIAPDAEEASEMPQEAPTPEAAPTTTPMPGELPVAPPGAPPAPVAAPLVLKRDKFTTQPPGSTWQAQTVTRRIIHREGPTADVVHFRDFLCPLTVPTVEEADCVAHYYDISYAQLIEIARSRDLLDLSTPERVEFTRQVMDKLRRLRNAAAPNYDAGARQPQLAKGEGATPDATHLGGIMAPEPIIQIAECYIRGDFNGDGYQESLLVMIDRQNWQPLYYDYVANVTPDGLRPFQIVRASEVEGRWYGQGTMEQFEGLQGAVDLLVNRMNKHQGDGGRVDFWRPQLTEEGKANPNLVLNRGQAYTPLANVRIEDILTSVYLQDVKTTEYQQFIEFFMQVAVNMSGVQHANDAGMVGLDSQKTATGITNVEKSGRELFTIYISEVLDGLKGVTKRCLHLLLANLREDTQFLWYEGENAIDMRIGPSEVQSLELDVQLSLTGARSEQELQQNTQALGVLDKFYSLPPALQSVYRPACLRILSRLGIPDADEWLQVGLYVPPPPEQKKAVA